MAVVKFKNRIDAGRQLARQLEEFRSRRDAVVLGLPRGGIPVAAEVARILDLDLDVIVVRKLGLPGQPEVAMGAIGEGGVKVVDDDLVRRAGVTREELARVEGREAGELERRTARYRGTRSAVSPAGRVAIVVDDGVATGSTARAACAVARAQGAVEVVLAVPVAPADWTRRLAGVADDYYAVIAPASMVAVGSHYIDFSQTTDEEVSACLQ